jgi:tRNA pseudouridine38-40 synthase
MPRFKLVLEYDGGGFVGWQRQENGFSVQQALEEAVFRFANETVTAVAAGRTDAGVHASGQVAHLDLARDWPPQTVIDATNFHLRPAPAVVLSCERVEGNFHARFDARRRHYRYRILTRAAPPVLDRGRVWHLPMTLDVAAMQAGAQVLVGRHDFSSFRAATCQALGPKDAGRSTGPRRRRSGGGAAARRSAPSGAGDGGVAQIGGRGQMERANPRARSRPATCCRSHGAGLGALFCA